MINISVEIYRDGKMLGYLIKTDKGERLNLSGFVSKYSISQAVGNRVRQLIEEGEKENA